MFIKLQITAQFGPVICSFYATALHVTHLALLLVNIFLARNARASRHSFSPHYDDSRPELHFFDVNHNALPGEKYGGTNAENGEQACPPPTHE